MVEESSTADLLLPLDHELDPDGRLAVPHAKRPDVGDDVRLRVRGAASEEGAVPFRELVWRRLPLLVGAGRDDVVVAVEQHRGRAFGRGDLADDDGRGIRQLEHRDVDSDLAEERGDCIVGSHDLRPRLLGEVHGRDGRDRDEIGEIGA